MAKDFMQEIESSYPIPSSIFITGGNKEADIRFTCDTVEDFQTVADSATDIRYDGLITYEKTNKRWMGCKSTGSGSWSWEAIGTPSGSGGTPGTDGREIELQKGSTHIQWRYKGESEWKNLISIQEITGPQGPKGDKGDPGIGGDGGSIPQEQIEQAVENVISKPNSIVATKEELNSKINYSDFSEKTEGELVKIYDTSNKPIINFNINGKTIVNEKNEISSLGDEGSVKIKIVGGYNLFRNTYGNQGSQGNYGVDFQSAIFKCEPNTTYTITKKQISNRYYIMTGNLDNGIEAGMTYISNEKNFNATKEFSVATITTSNTDDYIVIYYQYQGENLHIDFQIEKGNIASPFKSYNESKTIINIPISSSLIELPNGVVDSLIYNISKKEVLRKTQKIIIDGSDSFTYKAASVNNKSLYGVELLQCKDNMLPSKINCLVDGYKTIPQGDSSAINEGECYLTSTKNLYIAVKSGTAPSLEEVKSFFLQKNITIYTERIDYITETIQSIPNFHSCINITELSCDNTVKNIFTCEVSKDITISINNLNEKTQSNELKLPSKKFGIKYSTILDNSRGTSNIEEYPTLFGTKFSNGNIVGWLYYNSKNEILYSSGRPDNLIKLFDWQENLTVDTNNSPMYYTPFITEDGDIIFCWRGELQEGKEEIRARANPIIYKHTDYNNPVVIEISTIKPTGWLQNSGISEVEGKNGQKYIMYGEYCRTIHKQCHIWKITKPYDNPSNWNIVNTWQTSGSGIKGFKHIHVVSQDPISKVIYAGSGDDNDAAKIYATEDDGTNWNIMLEGTEAKARSLNFVYLEDGMYWGSDAPGQHVFNKISRGLDNKPEFSTYKMIYDFKDLQATYATCYIREPRGLLFLDRYDTNVPPRPLFLYFWSFETNSMHILDNNITRIRDNIAYGFRNEAVSFIQPRNYNKIVCGFGYWKNDMNIHGNSKNELKNLTLEVIKNF